MPMNYQQIHHECLKLSQSKNVEALKRFYQTHKGGYGEGDDFHGIKVPDSRALAKKHKDLSLAETKKLIQSKYHEERFIGLMILQGQYARAKLETEKKTLFTVYYKLRKHVNNWDLVDATAPYISGSYFYHCDLSLLLQLAESKKLWERRMAILSLFYFIRQKDFKLALKLLEKRLYDSEDLMHKACGWMLREIGNRDQKTLLKFLDVHAAAMPRTALRYSLEKIPVPQRRHYMSLYKKTN